MTHTLRIEPGEAAIANYKEEVKKPTAAQVMDTVIHWINEQVDANN